MRIRSLFAATLPGLLLLSALVGALFALIFPSPHVDRLPSSVAAAALRIGAEVRPAVYTPGEHSPEEQEAWVQLVTMFELVQSSQAVLEEAQSLRAIAGALAAGSTGPRASPEPSQGSEESTASRLQRELAQGQLALADKVLRTAQAHAANTQAAFGVAWQNVLRASQENSWQAAPTEPLRESAFHRRNPG